MVNRKTDVQKNTSLRIRLYPVRFETDYSIIAKNYVDDNNDDTNFPTVSNTFYYSR